MARTSGTTRSSSLRSHIGIVLQDSFLFTMNIARNIAYGTNDISQEEIERAAKIAHIHDFISSLPDGYETQVGERGVTLSGGQRQRIAIARTVLLDPRILILDDATSSVDMETEYQIQQALSIIMKGRTTFIIAQRLRTVRSADKILMLGDGAVVAAGNHDDLLRSSEAYQELYDLQLRDQEEAHEKADGHLMHGGMHWMNRMGGMEEELLRPPAYNAHVVRRLWKELGNIPKMADRRGRRGCRLLRNRYRPTLSDRIGHRQLHHV